MLPTTWDFVNLLPLPPSLFPVSSPLRLLWEPTFFSLYYEEQLKFPQVPNPKLLHSSTSRIQPLLEPTEVIDEQLFLCAFIVKKNSRNTQKNKRRK